MISKIKTTNKIKVDNIDDLCYIARRVVRFGIDAEKNKFVAVYSEYAFDIIETTVTNEDGSTSVTQVESLLKEYPQSGGTFDYDKINYFFEQAEDGIKSVEEFTYMIAQSLLLDTITQKDGGRYDTVEWEIYN